MKLNIEEYDYIEDIRKAVVRCEFADSVTLEIRKELSDISGKLWRLINAWENLSLKTQRILKKRDKGE